MRLATWNCQTGLSANWTSIEALDADVITIQECGPNTKSEVEAREGLTCAWQVGRYEKGVAVIARAPYVIERTDLSEPCTVSAIVAGPNGIRIRFVGFWAMTPTNDADTYPQQATDLVGWLPADEIPTVVAGDFNASSRNAHHLQNVDELAARGLVSAYHAHHQIEHTGTWQHPTSYHLWNQEKPHHMDYVFVPAAWDIESVDVGTFEDYPARKLSDHVPLTVTVDATSKPLT